MTGEYRFDPLTRTWVSIVGHRQLRPNLPTAGCPFCVGGLEAPQAYDVHWFENRWPAFTPGTPVAFEAEMRAGTRRVPAVGAAEVLLFSPDHDASLGTLSEAQLCKVVDLWADRTAALYARDDIEYVLVFENRGAEVGATIPHPHGQIYAFDHVPTIPRDEGEHSALHGCVVCADLDTELRDGERIVHDSSTWASYVPFASAYPYGVRIVAKEHVGSFIDLSAAQREGLAAALRDTLGRYDRLWRDDDRRSALFPYLLWFHQSAKHDDGRYHLHAHVAPPQRSAGVARYVASGELGSGIFSNPVLPETAAAALRDA